MDGKENVKYLSLNQFLYHFPNLRFSCVGKIFIISLLLWSGKIRNGILIT